MGKKTIQKIMMILVLLVILTGCRQQAKPMEQQGTTVEVTSVERKEIAQIVTLRGQLKPQREVMIFPKTPGLKVTNMSLEVGQEVKEGALLFELDKTLLRKQVEQAKINYDLAKENYNQQKNLQQEVPLRLQEDISVFKNIGGIPAKYQSMMGQSLQMESSQKTMEASLRAATAQLEQARMAYSSSLEQLNEMEYYAPISGVVSQLNIQKNQMVLNNAPAVVISDIKELKVVLSVSATLLRDLEKGQLVSIRIHQQEMEGKISTINPITDPRNNLHTVEVLVDNSQKKIPSGGFVHVDILREKKKDTLVIPKSALVTEGKDNFVFIEKDGKAHQQKVELGIDGDKEVEIVSGLEEGQQLIVKGQHFIEDQAPVIVRGKKNEVN